MELIIILIIAVSLSMDAFSLSLVYGTSNLSKRNIKLLSLIVGLYHFFMPLIGLLFGNQLFNYKNINTDFVVLMILIIIGVQMILSSNKKIEIKKLDNIEMILFGLVVSMDSFSLGITLPTITNKIFISSIIFSITSMIFTYSGLHLGKQINKKIGIYSNKIAGIILIVLGILYIL